MVVEDDRGDSRSIESGSGAGERATGTTKALTERAPMAIEANIILENMANGSDDSGTRPEVWEVGEVTAQQLRKLRSAPRPSYRFGEPVNIEFRLIAYD